MYWVMFREQVCGARPEYLPLAHSPTLLTNVYPEQHSGDSLPNASAVGNIKSISHLTESSASSPHLPPCRKATRPAAATE